MTGQYITVYTHSSTVKQNGSAGGDVGYSRCILDELIVQGYEGSSPVDDVALD